jgi:hypothetical protein
MRWPIGVCLALLPVLMLGGCGPAKYDKTQYVTVGPKEEQYLPMAPPDKPTKVTIAATTGGVPIELYLVAANNQEEAERIIRKQDTKNFIASRIDKVDPKTEGTLPKETGYVIVVVNTSRDKSAAVTIRITEP